LSQGIAPTPARQRARFPEVGKARRRRPTCAAGAAFASRNGVFAPESWDPGGARFSRRNDEGGSLPKIYEVLSPQHPRSSALVSSR
jgi:hypothetical protein